MLRWIFFNAEEAEGAEIRCAPLRNFAVFALEYCPIILAIWLVRCNDFDFASKAVVNVKADFFNAEDAECSEIRCGPLRNFAVFALEYCPIILAIWLERFNDSDFSLINQDYTTGYTLYSDPGVLLKVFFVQGISLLFFLPGNLRK